MAERLHELIAQQALHIAELEADLANLKRTKSATSTGHNAAKGKEREDRQQSISDTTTAYDLLLIQHKQLQANHARCEERLLKANHAYARAKEKVQEWHAYVQQQISRRHDRLSSSARKPSPLLGDRHGTDHSQPQTSTAVKLQTSLPATPLSNTRVEEERDGHGEAQELAALPCHTARTTGHFGSSQSTVVDPEPSQRTIKREAIDDDVPVIIHATSKRRRIATPKQAHIKVEPGTAQKPIDLPSDAQDQTSAPTKHYNESLDLDEPLGKSPIKKPPERQLRPHTPLRALPLPLLQLHHFKLNPKFTGPYLRTLDPNVTTPRRRCPPGCRRAECCGDKFRKMVELAGVKVSARSDEDVLLEYLGPRWSEVMASYEPERRKDVLIHAHAVSFAGTAYTRKVNHDRATTPPGFWRIEMPTTQENEEDAMRTADMERRMVKERWQEATRANGRWKFRDES